MPITLTGQTQLLKSKSTTDAPKQQHETYLAPRALLHAHFTRSLRDGSILPPGGTNPMCRLGSTDLV